MALPLSEEGSNLTDKAAGVNLPKTYNRSIVRYQRPLPVKVFLHLGRKGRIR